MITENTTEDNDEREATAIGALRTRLTDAEASNAGEVNAAIDRAIQYFAEVPIRTFVPLLVERRARDDLKVATWSRVP
jgi:hypothetical protein